MVIDDCEGDQFLCQEIIEEYDPEIEIFQSENGKSALKTLINLKRQPDLIFLDINMPRMDGHEFLEHYSKLDVPKRPAIVMLSSSDQDLDKEKAFKYDFVFDYLIKPLDDSSLNGITDKITKTLYQAEA
jgi:CheY-like chemotaxis protein